MIHKTNQMRKKKKNANAIFMVAIYICIANVVDILSWFCQFFLHILSSFVHYFSFHLHCSRYTHTHSEEEQNYVGQKKKKKEEERKKMSAA